MSPHMLQALQARREAITERWMTLLRIEPISGPLANPDALAYLVPDSLDRIFTALGRRRLPAPRTLAAAKVAVPDCNCGKNPYRAYYIAGEQAFTEAVVLLQAEQPAAERRESELAAALYAVRSLAADEVDSFCGLCTCRGSVAHCRHAAAAGR